MALPKKLEWTVESAAPRALPRGLGPSPAQQLQQLLDERALGEPHVERWSQRRALAFIVASASALWLAIIAAGVQAVKLVA